MLHSLHVVGCKALDEWHGNRRLLSGCIYKVSLAVVIYKRTILGLGSSLSMTY